MTSSRALKRAWSAFLVMARLVVWLARTSSGAQTCVAPVASAQALSSNRPALRSARVTVWVPVQTIESPGATALPLAGVQLKLVRAGVSLTVIDWVTLPVLVAVVG